jgi:protein gp37
MGDTTGIEWTEATWNPITGCTKVSPGCAYCYAERITLRMGGQKFLPGTTVITPRPERLSWPLKWKTPKLIFTSSMTDIFHEDVPFEFIAQAVEVIKKANWYTFQILTKRPERMKAFFEQYGKPPENAWLGTSVENQYWANKRLPVLTQIQGAQVLFASCEPLLSDLNLRSWLSSGLAWVILGGESAGPATRRLVVKTPDGWSPKEEALEWSRSIRDQCIEAGAFFFFKQWGGPRPASGGRLLDGEIWSEWPEGAKECKQLSP